MSYTAPMVFVIEVSTTLEPSDLSGTSAPTLKSRWFALVSCSGFPRRNGLPMGLWMEDEMDTYGELSKARVEMQNPLIYVSFINILLV